MKKIDIKIRFVDYWPEDEIVDLYKSGGWWKETYDKSKIKSLIQGSYAFAVAVDMSSGKALGMGRVISDGVSDAYIQDFVVLPDYRRQGIGKKLINELIKYCLLKDIQWIALISEPGNEKLFSAIGFETMKNHTPLRYQKVKI